MYDRDYESDYTGWSAFVAGAFIGAGVAILLAPPNRNGTARHTA